MCYWSLLSKRVVNLCYGSPRCQFLSIWISLELRHLKFFGSVSFSSVTVGLFTFLSSAMKEEIKRAKFVASSPLRYARRKLGSTSPCCPGKTKATATATLPQLSKMSSACSDCSSSNEQVSCSQSGATAISSRLEQLAAPRSSSSWRGTIQSKRISCREVPLSGSGGINTNVSENVNNDSWRSICQ